MKSQDPNSFDASFTQIGITAPGSFIKGICERAHVGFDGKNLRYGCAKIVNETICRLAMVDITGSLPNDKPLQLHDVIRLGGTTIRLKNCLINAHFQETCLKDIGDSDYVSLLKSPNFGMGSIVELMTIVDAFKQTNGFMKNSHKFQQSISNTEIWHAFSPSQLQGAIGRLIARIGEPEVARVVMPPYLELERNENRLGLPSPSAKKPDEPAQQ